MKREILRTHFTLSHLPRDQILTHSSKDSGLFLSIKLFFTCDYSCLICFSLFFRIINYHALSSIYFILFLNNLFSFCILVELCRFVPIYCNSVFYSVLIFWTWNWSVLWLCLYFYFNLLLYFISLSNSLFTFFDSQAVHLYLCLVYYFHIIVLISEKVSLLNLS